LARRLDDGKTGQNPTAFTPVGEKHFAAIIKMSIFAEMKTMVFATNNRHKILEISEMLKDIVIVKSLSDVGLSGEIPETADTLEGNALQKAMWVYERMPECKSGKMACFADDTGLEVEALGGRPGVYSARYAGEHCSFDDNINKMLAEMDGQTNRKACFRTVICLIEKAESGVNGERKTENGERATQEGAQASCLQKAQNGERATQEGEMSIKYFEGRVDGTILTERYGEEGFGYDPIFMPDRFAVSFAEMPLEVKNHISHRGRAVAKLVEYLRMKN
jgi:XTP/dITP diphosphohydrolase